MPSLASVFALLVKLATVAPDLWPHVITAFEAINRLVEGLAAAVGHPELPEAMPRTVEEPEVEEAILAIDAALPADESRAFGSGAFLRRLAAFLRNNPQFAAGFESLLGSLLGGIGK